MLFQRFINVIEDQKMICSGNTVVAAVSGGADSVCLLHLLHRLQKELEFSLICAHVNHQLRTEAGADADFVASICRSWDIPFVLHTEDVRKKAKAEGISLELAGRNVRYAFFASLGADVIMTAHNQNDAVESMLLHLTRGCGLEGLCGIPMKRKDGVYRPLLPFSRDEIEAYLRGKHLSWREDVTNLDTTYTRNKIRHTLIPLLEEMNPSFLKTASRTISILQAENAFLENAVPHASVISKEAGTTFLHIDTLSSLSPALQGRAVAAVTETFSDAAQVLSLIHAPCGTQYSISGGKIAEREKDCISIYQKSKHAIMPMPIPESGSTLFGLYRITVGPKGMALPKKAYIVRTRQDGDFFYPEGMQGKQKLKKYFSDKKIPRRLRDEIPILVCDGEIASVGTQRRSRNFIPQNEECIHVLIEPIADV